jgi:hypothetical protein
MTPTRLRELADWLEHDWGYLIGAPDARVGECIGAMREAAKPVALAMDLDRPSGFVVARLRIEPILGSGIERVVTFAVDVANRTGILVGFRFNDWECKVQPGETADEVMLRWTAFTQIR